MNRRTFLQTATLTATALAGVPFTKSFAAQPAQWPIGCFNRPWTKWSYDDALDGIAAAGFKFTGLLSSHRGEAFTSAAATPEYLVGLKKRIAQRGLAVNMTAIHFQADAPLQDNIAELRKQIEYTARLARKFML